MPEKATRPYDATRRRERAEAERLATRRRVVKAAGRLFVANGYVRTTIAEIAAEAGLAIPSVYKAAESKANLLQMAMDVAIRGDDEDVVLYERPNVTDIAGEADPKRQIELVAAMVTSIQERSAPLQVALREAAAQDAAVAASLIDHHRQRLDAFTVIFGWIPARYLQRSLEQTVDAAWVVTSPEVFNMFVSMRGWDVDRYRRWLTRTLTDQLLKDR